MTIKNYHFQVDIHKHEDVQDGMVITHFLHYAGPLEEITYERFLRASYEAFSADGLSLQTSCEIDVQLFIDGKPQLLVQLEKMPHGTEHHLMPHRDITYEDLYFQVKATMQPMLDHIAASNAVKH